MKIDKVIMCCDDNQQYAGYWNIVAKVWKEIYEIEPFLVFLGSHKSQEKYNFIYKENIINAEPQLNLPLSQVTWLPFWAAQKFPEDVCMTHGIDQMPLNYTFFDMLEKLEKTKKYVVGLSDIYKGYSVSTLGYYNTQTNIMFPTSHHVGKGKMFKEIYNLKEKWADEAKSYFDSMSRYSFIPSRNVGRGRMMNGWGLDECYSSEKISIYENQNEIEYVTGGWEWFENRRIHLGIRPENYSLSQIEAGEFSEITYKPYNRDPNAVNQIIELLYKIKEKREVGKSK